MHNVQLPAWAIERGRAMYDFQEIDPARTALVVVDLQTGFVADSPFSVPGVADIFPKVNRLSRAVRAAGGVVAFTRHTVSKEPGRIVPPWLEQRDMIAPAYAFFTAGGPGHGLHPDLDVGPDDIVVDKFRLSALLPQSSPLDGLLRARGIDTMIVVGAVTNMCCESTARDASCLDYRTIVVADATAAYTDDEHNASLLTLRLAVADVKWTEEIVQLVGHQTRS